MKLEDYIKGYYKFCELLGKTATEEEIEQVVKSYYEYYKYLDLERKVNDYEL